METGNIVAFNGAGLPLEWQTHEVRSLKPGEVLVKNLYTTICGSDLHTYSGVRKEACPTVLGHEIVGSIAAIDEAHSGLDNAGQELKLGDVITWSVFSSDPASVLALKGIPQKGDHLFKYGHAKIAGEEIFHGGLATYCILKQDTAILRVPEEMPLSVAATINCSIATAAGALRLAGGIKGKTVLITGLGLLGIACAAMCKSGGAAYVFAADIDEYRLATALHFGVNESIDSNKVSLNGPHDVKQLLSEKSIDVVFDMSGSAEAMEFGLSTLGVGGVAVWVGAVFNTRRIQVDAERIIRHLITIKGLHNYNFEDFINARDFMADNWDKYPFAEQVENQFTLEQAQDAFEYALKYKPLRVGVKI